MPRATSSAGHDLANGADALTAMPGSRMGAAGPKIRPQPGRRQRPAALRAAGLERAGQAVAVSSSPVSGLMAWMVTW